MGLDSSPLDAFRVWPAYIACHLVGPPGPWRRSRRPSILLREDPRGTADESGRLTLQVVSDTYRDGTVGFKYLDFGAAPGSCTVLAELDARSSGRIQVYIDEPYGRPADRHPAGTGTAVCAGWQTVEAETAPVAGTHAVFLVFQLDHGQIGDLSFFAFRRKEEGAATG
jgi:arabinoxylan arabinofuranohydrolase